MQEAQEQKSKSDPTEKEASRVEETGEAKEVKAMSPAAISIEPLAQQYQAFVPLTYDELRKKFDEHWEKNKVAILNRFPAKVRKEKNKTFPFKKAQKMLEKTVKPSKMYRGALIDLFIEKMDEREGEPESILFINEAELLNFEKGQECAAVFSFYYRPKLELNKDIDVKVKRPVQRNWNHVWNLRCKELQDKHKELTFYEGDDIREDQTVLMDIVASSNGKPDDELSCRLKWFELSQMRIPSLKEELLKHKKGDLFEISYIVEGMKEKNEEDREVQAQIKVHDLQTVTYPEVNDDLAMAENAEYESLAQLEEAEHKKYDQHIDSIEKGVAADHLVNEILQKSTIPPVPASWLNYNAQTKVDAHIQGSGGDKERAAKLVGANNEGQMFERFRNEVHQSYLRDLALRKYAKMFNVDGTNADAMTDDMVKRIDWIDEEVNNGEKA